MDATMYEMETYLALHAQPWMKCVVCVYIVVYK